MIELEEETSLARRTMADFVHDLGDIALDRIRMIPYPGSATIADLEQAQGCELVEGTLVEKAMGVPESFIAGQILIAVDPFVKARKLGFMLGADGSMKILSGLVRLPDVAFVSWMRTPDGRIPREPVPELVPDLAVEVVSRGNTPREMARKRREYFAAGVRRVWIVDWRARTITVFKSETELFTLSESDVLDGQDVLPGFSIPVREIFEGLDDTFTVDLAKPTR